MTTGSHFEGDGGGSAPDRSSGGPGRTGATRFDVLLVGLTVVSAGTDAISYLGLGRVFPANMTGNTVLLGIGLATGDLAAAARSATALGTFVLAAAVVGAAVPARASTRAFLGVLATEVGLLGSLFVWWHLSGQAAPTGGFRYGLIALAGLTMGAQSSLLFHLDAPVSTTYVTGTWTSISAATGARLRRGETAHPLVADRSLMVQVLVVIAYLSAACGAALAYQHLSATATAIPLAVLLLVTAGVLIWMGPMQPVRGR